MRLAERAVDVEMIADAGETGRDDIRLGLDSETDVADKCLGRDIPSSSLCGYSCRVSAARRTRVFSVGVISFFIGIKF